MAALFCNCGLESICQWDLGMVWRSWLLVGVAVSVGVDSLSLWLMGELWRRRLGMDAGWELVRGKQYSGFIDAQWRFRCG